MLNKKSLLLGILLSIMITTSFLTISNQISEKISAQSATNSSASTMMGNKTAASSDVLMNKVRSMGNLTGNATAAGPNMTK